MILTLLHNLAVSGFVCLLILAAVRDFTRYTIPNWICGAIVLLYPAHVILSPAPVDWISGTIIGAILLVVGFLFFVMRAFGGGDAKLMAAVGLWAGGALFGWFLVVTLISAVGVAIVVALRAAMVAPGGERRNLGGTLTSLRFVPLLKLTIPYGVAIAAGGIYVGIRLVTGT